jgi:hypothetical protein
VAHSEKTSHAVLSTGRKVPLDTSCVPGPLQLSTWTLTAEHWEAPEDLYDSQHSETQHNLRAHQPNILDQSPSPNKHIWSGLLQHHIHLATETRAQRPNCLMLSR